VADEIYRKDKKRTEDIKLTELRIEIKEASQLASKLSSKLLTLIRFREEIKDVVYRKEIIVLATEFNVLGQRLKNFVGGKKNVKQIEG
jgi:hypothetical protein